MIKAVSVKDRLKRQAVKDGKTMQEKLIAYGLERTVYRISVSEYADRFTLKGGIFLYALFGGEYARATRDIDLLAQHISNDADVMKKVFGNIFLTECDDALRFDMDSLSVSDITEFKEYHGVNVSIMGYLDRTRVPVSIDIGFDDVIFPKRMKMEFPVLLNMEIPQVYVYSIYSVIAEKFEAIVSLGLANGRYKDFYDIYILADSYDLDGAELKEAIVETFLHRETGYEEIAAFESGFTEDVIRQRRCKAFIRKKRTMREVEFEDAISSVKSLLMPIVDTIRTGALFNKTWSKESKQWIPQILSDTLQDKEYATMMQK